ncbi:MAG: serine hydrolase [Spirochaetes bacterium]|nr:serine hydrolase [Spirochaetota bacterium]
MCAMILLVSAFSSAEDFSTPKPEWQRKAAVYSALNGGVSMLVVIDGVTTIEEYPNGGSHDKAWQLASGTKSFWGPLTLIAEKEGLLTLDELVSDTITEWKGDPMRSRITVRHILSLTSGLPHCKELSPPYLDAIRFTTKHTPGEAFEYTAVSYQCLGEFLKRKFASVKMSPLDYLKSRIFEPIGLSVNDWNNGSDGNPILPWGAHLTAGEWMKYGELIRMGGVWKGKEIIPAASLKACFIGSKANPSYGLTWWLNTRKELPADLVIAGGAGDQRMYICPSLKTVAVRQRNIDLKALSAVKGKDKGDIRKILLERRNAKIYSDAEFCSLLFTGASSKNSAPMVQMHPGE